MSKTKLKLIEEVLNEGENGTFIAERDLRGNIIITFTDDTFFESGDQLIVVTDRKVMRWLKVEDDTQEKTYNN